MRASRCQLHQRSRASSSRRAIRSGSGDSVEYLVIGAKLNGRKAERQDGRTEATKVRGLAASAILPFCRPAISWFAARTDDRGELRQVDVAAGDHRDDLTVAGTPAERGSNRAAGGAFGNHAGPLRGQR